jgi:uncharacterized protein
MPIAFRTHRLALLLVLALTYPLATRADEASHRAKAKEVMTLLHTQRMVKQVSDNLTKQVTDAAESVASANPSPETKSKVADFEKQATQLIDTQLSWDSMQAGFLDVYTKNFTEEELDGIIAFYKTPAGTALLDKMPAVNSQVTQFGNTRMSALQPELKQQFEALRNSTATEPVAPAAPPSLGAPAAPATSAPKPSTPK